VVIQKGQIVKIIGFKSAAIALAFLCLSVAMPKAAVITKDYGTGSDTTYLLLQFEASPDQVLYTYHFTYNASNPLTGAELFTALDSADSALSVTYGGTASSNFYVTNVSYNGYSEPTSTQTSNGSSWTYFDSGGLEQALDSNFQPIPGQYNSVPSGSWQIANVGASNRVIQPNSWDGWVLGTWNYDSNTSNFSYTGAQPVLEPVPEPSTFVLLSLAGVAIFVLRRRRA
jgi:hypothetical protein